MVINNKAGGQPPAITFKAMDKIENANAGLIKNVFSFIHNIPIGIIDLAWPKDKYGWLNDHLNEKYKSFCIKEGYASPNAILSFFATLDSENAMIFCRKIDQIIKSKS